MTAQRSERARLGIELEWDVVGIQALGCQGDQSAERAFPDQPVKKFGASLFKVGGNVHDLWPVKSAKGLAPGCARIPRTNPASLDRKFIAPTPASPAFVRASADTSSSFR